MANLEDVLTEAEALIADIPKMWYVDIAGRMLNLIDLMVISDAIDPHDLQNAKLKARIAFNEKYGTLEDYVNVLPGLEPQIDPRS